MKSTIFGVVALACLNLQTVAHAELVRPNLPAPISSNFKNSLIYTAQVKQGSGSWQTLYVKRTESQDELMSSNNGGIYKNRQFHFTPLSFDPAEGALTIRITKDPQDIPESVSSNASNVEVVNADSGPVFIDANTVEFTLNEPKYVMVNFDVNSNKNVNSANGLSVIKYPLAIFADPDDSDLVEPVASSGQTKLVYSSTVTHQQMQDADIIVFRGGFHDVKNHPAAGAIPANNNKIIWLHPEALVTGHIERAGGGLGDDTLIYGRGVLYQGDFRNDPSNPSVGPYWSPNWKNVVPVPDMFEAIIAGDRATIRGIIVADTMWHGIVTRTDSTISRVKLWGWHGNNDAFRPSDGSLVEYNFMRAVDDALYSKDITVNNNLIYQSYNGAVLTCGWENVEDSGGTVFNNNIIYRPEWGGLGENNGIMVSQIGPYAECKDITFNNTQIYGDIAGITNLKESSRLSQANYDPAKHQGVPGIRNITFNNTTLNGNLFDKSRIDPTSNIVIENVEFNNLVVTGYQSGPVDNSDRASLFDGSGAQDDTVLNLFTGIPSGPQFLTHGVASERLRYRSSTDDFILDSGVGTWFQWDVIPVGNGWFRLEHLPTGKVLGSANDTDVVHLANTTTGDTVEWMYQDEGEWGRLIHRKTGLRMHMQEDDTRFILGSNSWEGNRTKWKFEAAN
ncbi:hypothetical protein DXV75_10765 [Alteromonas aestuariivivens]|uniref:Right-handed parallel beta-helix repeat-containing protein n=1 Tax=Alteromonas aestuariivivens TaxID=1938339 RepID=A0A3D8M5S7_9ALTE|nr:hypothetical protein [Alteromonas aestuariivivens]RDV25103.1 hypothetical protein DXV75_10765 [Alteromonas aestuariivivens]